MNSCIAITIKYRENTPICIEYKLTCIANLVYYQVAKSENDLHCQKSFVLTNVYLVSIVKL